MTHKIYFDGGFRISQKLMSLGFIIKNHSGKVIASGSRKWTENIATTNVAEYEALIAALEEAVELGIEHVAIYGDSRIIIGQVTGLYNVNSDHLRNKCDRAKKLLAVFVSYTIEWIPRDSNKEADRLTR